MGPLQAFAYHTVQDGLQQEPRKIYSQLAMPGNICNLQVQFTGFLLPRLPPPSASKETQVTFLLL